MENNPKFIKRDIGFHIDKTYTQWLINLKQRFNKGQIKAAIQVNTSLLDFYWNLGYDIVTKQKEYGWGSGLINQLSLDLRAAFPNIGGFSVINLKYIKKWYSFYNQFVEKVYQLGKQLPMFMLYQPGKKLEMPKPFALIPWKHHIAIVYGSKTLDEALLYRKHYF